MTTTLGELNALHAKILELDAEADRRKAALAEVQDELDLRKTEMIAALTAANLTSYRGERGQVVLSKRFTVKLPQSPDDWQKFWGYVQERGHYEALRTVNHQRLNGWYKAELDAAVERGEIDFHPDGLPPPFHQDVLSLRK